MGAMGTLNVLLNSVNDSPFTHLFSTIEVDFELHEITCAPIITVSNSVQRLCTLTFFNI